MGAQIERKLTTILAADVDGYSRLMEADEAAAMVALRESRAVFARLIERHRGRIANTAGDGLIADFPSVVEAVRCAAEVQTELAARNRQLAPDRAMNFRIGVNLGDVMVDGGDLFGEGVNLAARLQAMAEPGSVLISQPVYDQVRSKLAVGYESLGERRAKNLAEPITVYRVLLDGIAPVRARPPAPAADPAPAVATAVLARRSSLALQAQRLGILWAALLAIDLVTGPGLWAVWPGIAFLTALGVQAAPLLARRRLDIQLLRAGIVAVMLALINLASGSEEPWFIWPAGAVLAVALLARTFRPRQQADDGTAGD